MNDKIFSFVILHYIAMEETIKCVNSIINNYGEYNINIIIVDNYSNNGSIEKLMDMYKKNDAIHFILSSRNLGFANGNNLGFLYAKTNFHPHYIIMANNDTEFLQSNFLEMIDIEYANSGFAVLGPRILLRNNSVNKVRLELPPKSILKKELINIRLDYYTNLFFINSLYYAIRRLLKSLLVLFRIKRIIIDSVNNVDPNIRYENAILHGSVLIFSRKYINKYDGLDDRTFLYREEELLALRLKKSKLKSVYNPSLIVRHNEDISTNSITKTRRRKRLFVDKHLINSTKILLLELEKGEVE